MSDATRIGGNRAAAMGLAAVLAVGLAAIIGPAAAARLAQDRAEATGDRLSATIERAIHADGPFFTAEERAVIERACGYPAGSWDGYDANVSNGVLTCSNGRQVDNEEVRAVMEAAGPRIGARVRAAMARPEVRAAIAEVAREASAIALAALDEAGIERESAAEAREAAEEAIEDAQEAAEEAFDEAQPEW